MRTVQHILDSKVQPQNNVPAQMLVIDALGKMNEVNLSYVIVMEGDKYAGVFSERDYSRNVILKGRSSSNTEVKEVMTTELPTVWTADSVEQCMIAMIQGKSRYVVARNGNAFAGIITIHDLLREVIANKEGVFDSAAQELLDTDETGYIY